MVALIFKSLFKLPVRSVLPSLLNEIFHRHSFSWQVLQTNQRFSEPSSCNGFRYELSAIWQWFLPLRHLTISFWFRHIWDEMRLVILAAPSVFIGGSRFQDSPDELRSRHLAFHDFPPFPERLLYKLPTIAFYWLCWLLWNLVFWQILTLLPCLDCSQLCCFYNCFIVELLVVFAFCFCSCFTIHCFN